MRFSEFCQNFYAKEKALSGLKGITSQAKIVEFFLSTALGEEGVEKLPLSEDSYRKWFKGDNGRGPTASLWKAVIKYFDRQSFLQAIVINLNDNALFQTANNFGLQLTADKAVDKYSLAKALTDQFQFIASEFGEAENIVIKYYSTNICNRDYSEYLRNSVNRYGRIKTLLYSDVERPFYDFYVCNSIGSYIPFRSLDNEMAVIKNPTPISLEVQIDEYRRTGALIIGPGGLGKSMLMRHFFLTAANQYEETRILPILVFLRNYDGSLLRLITDSANRFDYQITVDEISTLLLNGKCLLLMDGLDEIKPERLDKFLMDLSQLFDKGYCTQIIISSREISSFIEMAPLQKFRILPFTLEQSLELIDKLEFYPEEPSIKQGFREKLESEYYQTHREFVENPLLLTLMLMRYRVFSDIPSKRYRFYEQAYLTLLRGHDSSKLAFQRRFRSVRELDDFTIVFREFCAKSFRKADYEFDERKIDEYLQKLKSIKDLDDFSLMTVSNFLFDACNSVCIMMKDGLTYHFIHRSFQEYFFADYYSRQDDDTLKKLGIYIAAKDSRRDDLNLSLSMLYELSPEKVDRFIIIPFLSQTFDLPEEFQYWDFLERNFGNLKFIKHRDLSEIKELFGLKFNSIKYIGIGQLNTYYLELAGMFTYREKHISALTPFIFKHFEIFPLIKWDSYYENDPTIDGFGEHDELSSINIIGDSLIKEDEGQIVETIQPLYEAHPEDIACRKAENGDPIILGHLYEFDYTLGKTDPDKYPDIVAYLSDDSHPCRQTFKLIKSIYVQLTEKYKYSDLWDDDF